MSLLLKVRSHHNIHQKFLPGTIVMRTYLVEFADFAATLERL